MASPDTFIDFTQILDHFGDKITLRGRRYAQEGRVTEVVWEEPWRVRALVVGSADLPYRTTATFSPMFLSGDQTELVPLGMSCTCPYGSNCKHAAALLIHLMDNPELISEEARNEGEDELDDPDMPLGLPAFLEAELRKRGIFEQVVFPASALSRRREPEEPLWLQLLQGLHTQTEEEKQALGIGVTVMVEDQGYGYSPPRIARAEDLEAGVSVMPVVLPLTPGKRQNWIKGNLVWDTFSSPTAIHKFGPAPTEVMAGIAECGNRRNHLHGYRHIDHLALGEMNGAMLWPLLERARKIGIPLVPQGLVKDVQILPAADLEFTVEDDEDCIHLLPMLNFGEHRMRFDELDLPMLPMGDTGFVQLIVLPPEERRHQVSLNLIPLREPMSEALQLMLLNCERVHVPAADAAKFTADFLPMAQHLAPVHSLDGSVEIPEAAPPRLRLLARFGAKHALILEWAWRYENPRRTLQLHGDGVLDGEGGRFAPRDRQAEQAVLERVRQLWAEAASQETMQLTGVRTAEFTDRVLPLLEDSDDVVVEIVGKRGEYAELDEAPVIRIGAEESGENDWYDLAVEVEIGGRPVPFRELFTALARGESHLLLPDGAYFSLDDPSLAKLAALIAEADALTDNVRERPRVSRYQSSLFDELSDLAEEVHAPPSWRNLLDGLRGQEGLPTHPVPESVEATLRPYQIDGYRWLCFLAEQRMGGILADDMGLGKTLQTLTFIARERAEKPDEPPFLVVAPTSVASNWLSEARKFTPHLDVRLLDVTAKKRGGSLADAVRGADVVVTSYAILRIDGEEFQGLGWSGLLLDEAQAVKNHVARTHLAAKRIRAPFRLAITGTPMENSLTDLWALMSLAVPGLYPSVTRFKRDYVKPIESGQEPEKMAVLRRRLRPFMLRRTKDLVAADLPEKQEQVSAVTLETKHRKLYDTVLQRERKKVLGLMQDFESNRIEVLSSLTRLRMLALDPGIVDGGKYEGTPSSKLEALLEQLQEVLAEGHRVIVFSQFTSFLKRVAERLQGLGVGFAYLDGATTQRGRVIERFRSGEVPLFLISLKAGGTGLTLTEADYVFLLDPWWNPAVEAQAVDRAHRIGQSSTVMVYRMVAEGTIEEKVLALQRRKAELFTSLMDDGAAFNQAITADDIRELLEDS
ncbi:MAG: DEAD/DEAH box helicase [Propionibacteriaceae bacterium]|nr:DEAD/DEAH box helicase [Propionibacteriaceae bacterium]